MAAEVKNERPHLVGRRDEMRVLRAALEAAVSGSASIVWLEGEAGIGKTRLLDELCAEAAVRGFGVFVGTTRELEHHRAFGVITEALKVLDGLGARRRRITDLLDLDPVAAQIPLASASEIEYRIGEELLALLEDECVKRPVLVALDDLQWADPATIAFLSRTGRTLPQGVLLTCARRLFPEAKDLDRVARDLASRGATRIRLAPLAVPLVAELVAGAAGGRPGPRLLAHADRAGGNPMFVLELVAALERDGEIERRGSMIEARSEQGAASLHLTILHRLSYLPNSVLELLRMASVLGTSFRVVDLSAMLGRPAADLVGAVEGGIGAGLLVEDGQHLRFRHDVIREALYEDLPASLRQAMHRDVATALVDSGAPFGVVAEHLLRGGALREADEVALVRRAAREVLATSPAAAVSLLEAVSQTNIALDERDPILGELAEAYYLAGRVDDAIGALKRLGSTMGTGHRQVLISALLAAGRKEEGFAELEAADAEWSSDAERAWANATWSVALMELGNAAAAAERARRSVEQARSSRDDVILCMALAQLAAMTSFGGRLVEGLAMAREASRLADRTPGRHGHRFHVEMFHAQLATFVDLLEEADGAARRGRSLAEELGTRWNLVFYYWTALNVYFLNGRWDDAIAEYESGVAVAETLGTRNGLQYAHALRGLIALHRGDARAADRFVALAEQEFEAAGPQYGTVEMMVARALVLEDGGESERALSILGNAWAMCATGFKPQLPWLGPYMVHMTLNGGDGATAMAVADVLEELAAVAGDVDIVNGAAERCAALVTGDPDAHATALERYRSSPRIHEHALAAADAAEASAAAGRAPAARTLFEESLSLLSQLEAIRDIERVKQRMRHHGIARTRGRSKTKPRFGWGSLTETELRVARLVAQGLSNPQIAQSLIVSRYTVQTHVAHILAKLNASSRAELAAEVVRQEHARTDR